MALLSSYLGHRDKVVIKVFSRNFKKLVLNEENRGKYHRENIFDIYPDFENDLLEFTLDQVLQKSA